MSKKIDKGVKAKRKLIQGVNELADAVKVTLGAAGRNVVMESHFNGIHVTKDGVTVAKSIELSNPVKNMGAQMIKQASARTGDLVGDGTTTSTVITQGILSDVNFDKTINMVEVKRGIEKGVKQIIEFLKKQSISVADDNSKIQNIATISANNDIEVGNLIAEVYQKIGNSGVVTMSESTNSDTYIDIVEGIQFDRGFISPYFVTDKDRLECILEEPYILYYDDKLNYIQEILPLLETVAKEQRPIVIIAEDISEESLRVLVSNHVKGTLKAVFVKSPSFGDERSKILEDMAVATYGSIISENKGTKLSSATIDDLGEATKVIVSRDNTIIVGDNDENKELQERLINLKSLVKSEKDKTEKSNLEKRIANLTNGVAVIKVGAATDVELQEKKDRVEDALFATKAAIAEGVVAGGGVPLFKSVVVLENLEGDNDSQQVGIELLKKGIVAPFFTILENAGLETTEISENVFSSDVEDYGYNVKTNQYEKFIDTGVIDPLKVTRIALENAASVAGMILTTECTITDKE